MSKAVLHLSVSLDGFAAGLRTSPAHPLGEGGEALHRWMFGIDEIRPSPVDKSQAAMLLSGSGAFILGRTMFDVGEPLWGPDGAFGKPCFVLTHRYQQPIVKGPTTFTFVNVGIEWALANAKLAANGQDVAVVGGPTTAQQYIAAGLIDEVNLHLVPVSLGSGIRLFDEVSSEFQFRPVGAIHTDLAFHLTLRRADDCGGSR